MDKEDFCLSLEYMKLIHVSGVEWSNRTKDTRSPRIHTSTIEPRHRRLEGDDSRLFIGCSPKNWHIRLSNYDFD